MIIYTNKGAVAYDEKFHKGINIIRGKNSSGKSTLTHFIFFILGGSFNDWVKEAKKCSRVIAEVEMNGATITLKRDIVLNEVGRANDKEGLSFFWGPLEDALKNSIDWQKFNFNTTADRKSYSNVIFENLDLPIVKGENNITFHQILRLLYVDQESPTSSLFYYEQFDSSLTRETVSDLLLGVYNQELYGKKQRKIEVEKELDNVASEIRVIKKFIPNPLNLIPANILTNIHNKESELSEIEESIIALRDKNKAIKYTAKTKLEFEELNSQAIFQRKVIKELENLTRIFQLEVEDTDYFILALEHKHLAIKKSILTRDFLGKLPLENCPECLSVLEPVDIGTCKLCKKPVDESYGITQARKIEQEISFQVKESKKIIETKKREVMELKAKYESEQIKLHQIQTKVNQALADVKPLRDEKIDKLYVDKGFVEGEIIQLRTLLENAEIYQSLVKKQTELEQELEGLKYSIDKITTEQDRLKRDTNREIEKKGVYLLNNDLKRQSEFFEATEFHIDYRNNLAFISDKEAKYSASSSFYLKTSARFAIFLASLSISKMRYPRFVFCDNMEDKGIEEGRAQNFQRILIAETEKYSKDSYQLIYTTSFIPDELDNTEYCVGEYYSEENPTLKNV